MTAESGVAKLTLVKNEWKSRRASKREKSYQCSESGSAVCVCARPVKFSLSSTVNHSFSNSV